MTSVGIVDYGSGNFASVWDAVSQVSTSVGRITSPSELRRHSHIILPGVGSFRGAVQKLKHQGLFEPICSMANLGEVPLLGICVGMQILADTGFEFGETTGMGVVPGEVRRLTNAYQGERLPLPHIGWNNVEPSASSRLFAHWASEDFDFYFLHSFHLDSKEFGLASSTCFYGEKFIASIERLNTFGVQFHPEKSQINGLKLLQRFIEI